jgi:hypothetical protein
MGGQQMKDLEPRLSEDTNHLIDRLVADSGPVQRVSHPLWGLLRWSACSLLCVAVGVAFIGVREDWVEKVRETEVVFGVFVCFILALFSAASAFLLSIPDRSRRITWILPLITALAWAILLILRWNTEAVAFVPGLGVDCVESTLGLSIVPGALLFWFINRGAALRRKQVALFASLGAAAFGGVGTMLVCSDDGPVHLILWHFLPILVIAGLGFWFGSRFIRNRLTE